MPNFVKMVIKSYKIVYVDNDMEICLCVHYDISLIPV